MKKYLAIFIAVTVFTSAAAFAQETDPKKCYKACMQQFKDKEICDYVCKDGPKPIGKLKSDFPQPAPEPEPSTPKKE